VGCPTHRFKVFQILQTKFGQKKATLRWLFKSTKLIGEITSLQKLLQKQERLVQKLLQKQERLVQKLLQQLELLQELERLQEQLLLFYRKQREQQKR